MSGHNNTTVPPMTEDEQKKYKQSWSTHILGYNVPYWVVVLLVVILVYIIYTYSSNTKESVSLPSNALNALNTQQTMSSPTSSMNSNQGAASFNVASDASTQKLQRELRELFSKY